MKTLGYTFLGIASITAINKISDPIHAIYFIGIIGGLGLALGLYSTVRRAMMQ